MATENSMENDRSLAGYLSKVRKINFNEVIPANILKPDGFT